MFVSMCSMQDLLCTKYPQLQVQVKENVGVCVHACISEMVACVYA